MRKQDYARQYAEQKAERMTYGDFFKLFPDDNACIRFIWKARYGDMRTCPQCGKYTKFYKLKQRKQFNCGQCNYQISPLASTIFHKSSTPLSYWFYAIYLVSISKNGVSSKELERQLGVTYKTAFRINHKIREAMERGNFPVYFEGGTTEIDDSYFGGKIKNKHAWERKEMEKKHGSLGGRAKANKTVAIGAVNREERKAQVEVLQGGAPTLRDTDNFIADTLNKRSNHVITDDWTAYMKLHKRGVYHSVVNHGKGEYGRGDVHTNGIENLWSNIKRGLDGTYRGVSRKYLYRYLAEFVWRYNHRGQKTLYPLVEAVSRPLTG